MKNNKNIQCLNCLLRFKVNRIPDKCPNCNMIFNKHAGDGNVLDVILNFLTKNNEKGYVECDPMGWSKGDGLTFPNERIGQL